MKTINEIFNEIFSLYNTDVTIATTKENQNELYKELFSEQKKYSKYKPETKNNYYYLYRKLINSSLLRSIDSNITIGAEIEMIYYKIRNTHGTIEDKNKSLLEELKKLRSKYEKADALYTEQISYINYKINTACLFPALNTELTIGEEIEYIILENKLKGINNKQIVQRLRAELRRYLTKKNVYEQQVNFINRIISNYID